MLAKLVSNAEMARPNDNTQRLERIYRKHVKELEKDLDRTEDELQSVLVKYGEHEIDYTQNIWVNDTEKPES